MINIEKMNQFFRKAGKTILRFRWAAIILFLLVFLFAVSGLVMLFLKSGRRQIVAFRIEA